MNVGVRACHLLHAVLEGKLALLQGHFFKLFRGRKVGFVGELVQAMVQVVVLFGQLAIAVIMLQQQASYGLCFLRIHRLASFVEEGLPTLQAARNIAQSN